MKKNQKIIVSILVIIAAAILLFLPKMVQNVYSLHIVIMAIIYTMTVQSLNLIAGYSGACSIGHAAFYGLGAYTSALLAVNFGWSFWVTALCGIIVAAIFGLILAIPVLKLKSSYLVITTIAFGKVIHLLFLNMIELTKGPNGVTGIPVPSLFGYEFAAKDQYYYFALFFAVVVAFLYYRLYHSRTGRAIKSVREDDIAAELIGVPVVYYKVFAFVVGTATAGLAGALYAHYIHFISPETFSINESIAELVMLMVGGIGTFLGPILGAFGITILLEKLRFLSDYRQMIYGAILFLIIFVMPRGLVGLYESIKRAIKKKMHKTDAGSAPPATKIPKEGVSE